jgi:hypothetical protein
LLAGPEESVAKRNETLVALATVEKEFAGKVKKLSQRYANYDFYLQGNGHLGRMFPASAGTESMEIFVQANRLQSGLEQSQVSRIMKSARDFRIEGGKLQGYRQCYCRGCLIAESALPENLCREIRRC